MVRPVGGGCWWALAVIVVAPLLWAGPAAADTTLDVDAGYAGSFIPGHEVPVRVRISADRLVHGTLEVQVGTLGDAAPVVLPVDVPGGSQKQFLVAAPAGMNQAPDVVARLRQGDRLVASGQTTVRAAGDTELVGILPGALRGRAVPGVVPLAVDAGTARFAAVGDAELEAAPASLGPLSTLAADVDDLARLSPAARAGVLRWIDGGGRLLLDSAGGQPVDGLPPAWLPGSTGRAPAGLGEVVATDGAIGAGRWSGLVEPSGWGAVSSRTFFGATSVAGSLAADAGLRTPEIGWLVGFLAVYVVLVGPVLFLAVRRRGRPELAWVAVPLVAILFSTGSYAVGRNLRRTTRVVHATVLASGLAGTVATTYVGVVARAGGTQRIGFPAGWTSGQFVELGSGVATPDRVTLTAEGPETALALDVGQFGIAHASGPAPNAGGLEVIASPDGAHVTGTVRNRTAFALDDVAVFVGTAATPVGNLAAGEQRTFTAPAASSGTGNGPFGDFAIWGGPSGSQGRDGQADFALWQAAVQSGGINFTAPDRVVVAGWTREFAPAVRVSGGTARPQGRTLVIGRQQLPSVPRGATSLAAHRDIVRDPTSAKLTGAGTFASVARFVLPEGADTSNLVLATSAGPVELWQDGAWRGAACEGGGCGVAGVVCPPGVAACPGPPPIALQGVASAIPVPAGTVKAGVVYARLIVGISLDQGVPFVLGRSA